MSRGVGRDPQASWTPAPVPARDSPTVHTMCHGLAAACETAAQEDPGTSFAQKCNGGARVVHYLVLVYSHQHRAMALDERRSDICNGVVSQAMVS